MELSEENSAFLKTAADHLGITLARPGQLLDNGFSQSPSEQGKAIKEYWYTKGSDQTTLIELCENTSEEYLQQVLHDGANYLEKLRSQVTFTAKNAQLYTIDDIHIAVSNANTGVLEQHDMVLSIHDTVDISLIKVGDIAPEYDITRYSMQIRQGSNHSHRLHAGEIANQLAVKFPFEIKRNGGKMLTNSGGGFNSNAGFLVQAHFKALLAAFEELLK